MGPINSKQTNQKKNKPQNVILKSLKLDIQLYVQTQKNILANTSSYTVPHSLTNDCSLRAKPLSVDESHTIIFF